MPNRGVLLPALLAAMAILAPDDGSAVAAGRTALEIEVIENTLDGTGREGCRFTYLVEDGVPADWWIAFGTTGPSRSGSWEAIGSPVYCGTGTFDSASPDLRRLIREPYLLVSLTVGGTLAAGDQGRSADRGLVLRTRKLDRFLAGRAVYSSPASERIIRLEPPLDTAVPLLLPDPRERDAFAVHDVLLAIRTTPIGGTSAQYGSIAVTADLPGAEILLDGAFAGRIIENAPVLLANVPTGRRTVTVRDFSGREIRRDVVVEKDRRGAVVLKALNPAGPSNRSAVSRVGRNPQGHQEFWRPRDGALVVEIPAGEFLMGNPEGHGEPSERPQRRINLSRFLIDKLEVTWRQFRKFSQATGVPMPPAPLWGTPDDYPVSNVLWGEAKAYCEWVGGRLPTEAEWEKAARGTDGRKFPWGEAWDPHRCNSWEGGPNRPLSAGSHPGCISPYGVLDQPGSFWEWCADWFTPGYDPAASADDPKGPATGTMRVLRGGSWIDQSSYLRPAHRHRNSPESRNVLHGFRCAHGGP